VITNHQRYRRTDGQTDGRTDGRHAIPIPRICTKVHCAVKTLKASDTIEIVGLYTALMLLWCAGNDYIHLLTSQKRQVLHVDLGDWEGNTAWAEYDDFKVGNEATKYKLISLGEYSGDAGESVVG